MNNNTTPPDHVRPGDEAMVAVSVASLHATIETLARFEQFFRHHASPTTLAELRTYCAALGWHGVCGTQALLDDLGFNAFALRHALDIADETGARPDHDQR
jgi:hypothetical protein